jgi:F-type H+-transporting ATPase subunit epsilon
METKHTLHVSIVTPETTAFEGDALAVSVPGSKSPFQVLYNHAPIISSLDIGIIKIESPTNTVSVFAAKEGFVEVLKNTVNIVVSELLPASTIDEGDAEKAVDAAREHYNEVHGRADRKQALDALHWAEAQWRAARLDREFIA